MSVLVTGATGFIGYSLCEALAGLGYDVWGTVRIASRRHRLPEGVSAVACDIEDAHAVRRAVRLVGPEVVFHLAALTPVSESFSHPRLYADVNYRGTINLAEACLERYEGLKAFVFASTTEVFGNQDAELLHEGLCPRPNTPYAVSKYAAECYLRFYMREAYDFPVVVARPCNTYGRALVNQPHFVVEKMITEMLRGREELHLGDPSPVRDFMFRDDHVNAYLRILDAVERGKDIFGEVFCFGTGRGITIEELAGKVAELTGWEGRVIWRAGHSRPVDIERIVVDASKAKGVLGWEPKYSLEEGLKRAIDEWREALGL